MEKPSSTTCDQSFPKSFRLLKKKDFSFRPYKRHDSAHFLLIYGQKGSGRLGISIAKKVLKNAAQRNRIKRLVRESFRKNRNNFESLDIHVVAKEPLKKDWDKQTLESVTKELMELVSA